MRLTLATKRATGMSERRLLFLMTARQAEAFARLVAAAERGDGAAAQALGTASMNLGHCYLRGRGVAADEAEALRLFRLAVEQGEEKAEQDVVRLENPAGRPKVGFPCTSEAASHLGPGGTSGVEPSVDGTRKEEQ